MLEPLLVLFMMILMIFLFTWLCSKKTIVFWVYFNSIMLVVYLPMLDIFTPSNVVLFMTPFIDMFRGKLSALLGRDTIST